MAQEEQGGWELQDGLLLKDNQLFVSEDNPELHTHLLDEVHRQKSTAHPSRNETQQLVKS